MRYSYETKGVCSDMIDIEVDDGIIEDVRFYGGCNGNLKAISKLVQGKKIDDVIDMLSGIKCGFKSTSCGDQLAIALKSLKEKI